MASMYDAHPMTSWRTLLGDYPTTHALRRGTLVSSTLSLTFEDVRVPNKAFKRVVRDLEFDVAEIALMTYLMARSRGVPLRLLPVVIFGRNPLPYLVCAATRRVRPGDLGGCRIGVRAYTTTTAVWIRALLTELCGVDFERAEWTTIEEGHVEGVTEPPAVRRDPSADLVAMLREGALDAVIVDPVPGEPWCVPVVEDAEAMYGAWRQRSGACAVNHVVAVRESLACDEPAMRELFRLFRESRDLGGEAAESMAAPPGLDANRRNFEVAIAAAQAQHLLAQPLTVDDIVTDAIASLR